MASAAVIKRSSRCKQIIAIRSRRKTLLRGRRTVGGGPCRARNCIMNRRRFPKAGLLAATALTGAAMSGAVPARADDTGSQISSIEKQIRQLQGELGRMKHSLTQRDADVRAARAEAAAANRQAMSLSDRRTNSFGQPMAPGSLSAPPGYSVNIAGSGSIPKYGPLRLCRRRADPCAVSRSEAEAGPVRPRRHPRDAGRLHRGRRRSPGPATRRSTSEATSTTAFRTPTARTTTLRNSASLRARAGSRCLPRVIRTA